MQRESRGTAMGRIAVNLRTVLSENCILVASRLAVLKANKLAAVALPGDQQSVLVDSSRCL